MLFVILIIKETFSCQVEAKYEEEREVIQQELLREQNGLLTKYRQGEVCVSVAIHSVAKYRQGGVTMAYYLGDTKLIVWSLDLKF